MNSPTVEAVRGPAPFRAGSLARALTLGLLAYMVYAMFQLDFSWPRFVSGLSRGGQLIARMFPPDLGKGGLTMIEWACVRPKPGSPRG